jgi:hypothetical protein
MTGRELPPTVTNVSAPDAWAAFGRAWQAATGHAPTRETLACLVAQWALETGWGKEMRCFNPGNVKATAKWGGDYAYFATSERLTPEAAQSALNRAGVRDDGTPDVAVSDWTPNDKGKVKVLFYPKNPATKFRAFSTLQEGCDRQVRTLRSDFATTLPALERGDPAEWAGALSRAHYYTADPAVYANTLSQIHADLLRRGYPMPTGGGEAPPPPPAPAPPASSSSTVPLLFAIAAVLSGGKL